MLNKILLSLFSVTSITFAGVVSGVVRDSDGSPIANAKVAIPSLNIERNADQQGRYSLPGVPSGTYDILFGAENYQMGYLKDVSFDGTSIADNNRKRYKMDLSVSRVAGNNRISFVIPDRNGTAPVKITLFNLKGRVIRQITDSHFSAGLHSVDLPDGIAPGMYAVKLNIANNSIFKKMITY